VFCVSRFPNLFCFECLVSLSGCFVLFVIYMEVAISAQVFVVELVVTGFIYGLSVV
jgi:hypothetical protein